METFYILSVICTFWAFIWAKKKNGCVTLVDVMVSGVISLIPLFNLLIAFYALSEK